MVWHRVLFQSPVKRKQRENAFQKEKKDLAGLIVLRTWIWLVCIRETSLVRIVSFKILSQKCQWSCNDSRAANRWNGGDTNWKEILLGSAHNSFLLSDPFFFRLIKTYINFLLRFPSQGRYTSRELCYDNLMSDDVLSTSSLYNQRKVAYLMEGSLYLQILAQEFESRGFFLNIILKAEG